MSIEADLKREMSKNEYVLDIIEADALIAVWRYQQCNRFTRSANFCMVPHEYRYAAPPVGSDNLMPCHTSYWIKNNRRYSHVKPAFELFTRSASPYRA